MKYVLPNANTDTDTLTVTIQTSSTDTDTKTYSLANDITTINATSTVYFLDEVEDGKYEVQFGDGILGKQLSNGNIVILSSLICDATVTNDTEAGYLQITPDGTGTDNTRNSNTFIIGYIANPSHMPTSWGRIRSMGTGLNGFQGNSAPFWYEKSDQLIGSTGFDGVRIYATSGNISDGTFFIYGMA